MTLPVRDWPTAVLTLGRTYGLRGAALRTVHELRRAAGRFLPAPAQRADRPDPPDPHPFRVEAIRLAEVTDRERALERAERVVAGEYLAYGRQWRALPAEPGDWLRWPTGAAHSGAEPWWEVPLGSSGGLDIKDLWEPARFGWAYDLVRGWLLTADDRFARTLHHRLATWEAAAPPYRGPHWACGQEAAIRAAALLYAEANLAGSAANTPDAMQRLARILAATGERIDDALGYALSQRNNHAISEAAGLVMLGVRFRGRHPSADRWLARGRRWLERVIPEQFAADGWYIQHSFNYARLALDQCVLAQRALDSIGASLSRPAVDRIRAAADLIAWVMAAEDGVVPNHGPNDGALVHPVSVAPYRDFRPTLTAVCATFGHPLPADIPPDPEPAAWLGRPVPEAGPERTRGVRTGASGWAAARVGGAAVFLRAGTYRSRPGHIDPLQLDVRFGTDELVVDPGTFSYARSEPWDGRLAGAAVHNTPRVDGRTYARRGPRFLWLRWPRARIREAREEGGGVRIIAEIPDAVRREVWVGPSAVEVVDSPAAGRPGPVETRWLLHPDAGREAVEVPGGSWHAATEDSPYGWFCPGYGERVASSWVEARSSERIVSRFRRPSVVPDPEDD